MKSEKWEARNCKLNEDYVREQFDLLRDMLVLKEKEILANIKEKTHETIEGLCIFFVQHFADKEDINTKDTEMTRAKLQQTIRENEDLLQIDDPDLLLKTSKYVEKKQEMRLKDFDTSDMKMTEVIVNDYTFQLDIKNIVYL
jgi:hypothetical protein